LFRAEDSEVASRPDRLQIISIAHKAHGLGESCRSRLTFERGSLGAVADHEQLQSLVASASTTQSRDQQPNPLHRCEATDERADDIPLAIAEPGACPGPRGGLNRVEPFEIESQRDHPKLLAGGDPQPNQVVNGGSADADQRVGARCQTSLQASVET